MKMPPGKPGRFTKLASGNLSAWAQRGYEPEFEVHAAHWTRPFGNVVSSGSIRFEGGFDRVLVKRSAVLKLWPATPKRRGAPGKHDWEWWKERALELLRSDPHLSQTKLKMSLSVLQPPDGRRVPAEDHIRDKLREWGLPPGGK